MPLAGRSAPGKVWMGTRDAHSLKIPFYGGIHQQPHRYPSEL